MPKFKERNEVELSNPIYQLRIKRKWSLSYLAEKLEVSRQLLFSWESGKALPRPINLQKLEEAGVNIDELRSWQRSIKI